MQIKRVFKSMFTFNIKKSLEVFLVCFKPSFSRYGTP
jgi:hypothetical protein